ncbi:MAG: hypothetical protein RIG61_07375 [Deltaproteobacteria bacterium]
MKEGTTAQGEFSTSLVDLVKNAGEGAVIFGHTKEELGELLGVTEDVTESTNNLSQDGLQGVIDQTGQASKSIDTMSTSVEGVDTAAQTAADGGLDEFSERVENLNESGGFFEGIKQGFEDFVESVGSNSELIADFFANTLSQMSQNFSDLFFNVLTGKFEDLKDLVKQAFEAILRSFLDLVAAIVTKQIVVSIGALFGLAGSARGAGGSADIVGGVGGIGGSIGDILGGGSGIAGLFGFAGGAAATIPATAVPGSLGVGGLTGGVSVGTLAAGELPSTGFLAGIGGIGGALSILGAVAVAAALAIPLLSGLFKKTPRLDIEFDSIKEEGERRAAFISELLDTDTLINDIIDISVKRSAGLGVGGSDKIKEILGDAIQGAVNNLLDIINKLPADLADKLTDELLNTELDTETVVAGERLFEFDAKGKKIAEKFNQLINGEIQAKFLFAVDGFLQTMFESLGVLPDAAASFLDERFREFESAGSREARAAVGQDLLADLNAFVDAFNIVEGNINDAIGTTINSVNSLSRTLGFDAVPSIDQLTEELGELIKNAELDPETVQNYVELRNAILSLTSEIVSSISSLIGKISQLNSTIAGFGGSSVDLTGFLNTAIGQVQGFFTDNIENLSLSEQEALLDDLAGLGNQLLAEEQAAFQARQEAARRAAEAQRAAIERRIDGLNEEKERIQEAFDERIDALNEELRLAEEFASLAESIRRTLDSILFSPESVLTGVEQVNALQSNIAQLQQELAGTVDPERQVEIVARLEDAFKTLFDVAGDAFGVNSPEFVAIFDQVTGGLDALAELTETRGRSVEEINAEIERLTQEQNAQIERIDARIEALQDRLSAIGEQTAQNTFQASQRLIELFEFIRGEYIRILEERFAQLEEVSEFGFDNEIEGLQAIAGINDEQLVVLRSIESVLQNVQGFAEGTGGLIRDFGRGTLAVLHGREAVLTEDQLVQLRAGLINQFVSAVASGPGLADQFRESIGTGDGLLSRFVERIGGDEGGSGEMHVDINVNVNGGSGATAASIGTEIENMLVRSIRQGGRLRSAIQDAGAKRLN